MQNVCIGFNGFLIFTIVAGLIYFKKKQLSPRVSPRSDGDGAPAGDGDVETGNAGHDEDDQNHDTSSSEEEPEYV